MADQESLLEIQEKYRSLVENLSVGVYRNTPGPKGHFLEANSAIVAMFEAKSKEEFLRHNVSDLYQNPEERQDFVAEMTKKGEVKNREINLITLKGKRLIGSVTAVMKKNSKGEVYFDGIVEDITEHKKIESELGKYRKNLEDRVKARTQELETTKEAMLNVMEDLEKAKETIGIEKAKDDAMLASIGEGLVAVDNQGKIIVMNETAEDMLELRLEDMVGKQLTILPLEDDEGIPVPLEKRPTTMALSTGEAVKITYFFVRKNKTRFPIAITATPIKLDGKTIGLIEMIRDVTEEQEIDKAKSEFVSLASHQLRTPLGIMKWYLEALDQEDYIKKSPVTVRNYFDEIHKSNERVLSLVRDLLLVSRIEQRHVKNAPKPTDVVEIIKEVTEQMKILAHQNGITLTLNIVGGKKPIINIDSLRFHEVIENLIANAVTYSNPQSKVEVTVDQKGDTVVIEVKDNGVGISRKDQKKLFTKFFRTQDGVAKNTEGSGLGLYLVKSYVDGWGGNVAVKSNLGKGSIFSITIPIKMKEGDN